jgi:hypothetical protein
MAVTTGLVQRLTWVGSVLCAWIGPTLTSAELFLVVFESSDTDTELSFKRNAAKMLARAAFTGYPATVVHGDQSALIDSVSTGGFNISPVGYAVHDDLYSVTGEGIPADAKVVFDSPTVTVSVTPDLIRPYWVLLETLPTSIPIGRNQVRLEGTGLVSDWVPVEVSATPPVPVRVLYSGEPKDQPYNLVLLANPAIRTEASNIVPDPVLTNRAAYRDVVAFVLRNCLTLTEDLLRQNDWDREMRFVSVFDGTAAAIDANALVQEDHPNVMEPRRALLNSFLAPYGETADIVFAIHGSTTHDRAFSWFTTDDAARPGTAYIHDGIARTHGHFPSIPGSVALALDADQTGLTPLHEFGHAGSDFNNGKVADLYLDTVVGFNVNKKVRALGTPIPANFANYNGTNYLSDQNRDGLGYPATWTSYHSALIDATHPNLMDNYWLAAGGNPQVCRLDQLTYAWYSDRLRAKLRR